MTRSLLRATLLLGHACDNACVFCGQHGVQAPSPELDPRAVLLELRQHHDEVTFVGGEPALDPRLPELVTHARELGYAAIGLQTNGRRLAADPTLLASLAAAGLGDLQLSVHGATAEVHDYHTGRPGSFAALLDVMARAQRAGLTQVATTIITRSNFRELGKLPALLKRRGIAGWLLEPVRPYGAAADQFARVVPRLGMALPWALLALEQARRNDLAAWIRGAPLCALGPFAGQALPDLPSAYGSRDQPEPCVACPARARCPGVDPGYLAVFGSKELTPREARPLTELDPSKARLTRMFVGSGVLLDRAPQLRSPAPPGADVSKIRRLPVVTDLPDSGESS